MPYYQDPSGAGGSSQMPDQRPVQPEAGAGDGSGVPRETAEQSQPTGPVKPETPGTPEFGAAATEEDIGVPMGKGEDFLPSVEPPPSENDSANEEGGPVGYPPVTPSEVVAPGQPDVSGSPSEFNTGGQDSPDVSGLSPVAPPPAESPAPSAEENRAPEESANVPVNESTPLAAPFANSQQEEEGGEANKEGELEKLLNEIRLLVTEKLDAKKRNEVFALLEIIRQLCTSTEEK